MKLGTCEERRLGCAIEVAAELEKESIDQLVIPGQNNLVKIYIAMTNLLLAVGNV